jgi:hypothetical protein
MYTVVMLMDIQVSTVCGAYFFGQTLPTQQLFLVNNFRFELHPSTLKPLVAQIFLAAFVIFSVHQGRSLAQVQKDRFCAE